MIADPGAAHPLPVLDQTATPPAESPAHSPDMPAEPADRPWRRAALAALLVWLASRLGLAVVTAVAWIGQNESGLTVGSVARKWSTQWDSTWFMSIAIQGYVKTPDLSHYAFFPLYPILIRVLTPVFFGRYWLAALVVANLALFVALVLLYRLAEQEFGRSSANRAIFYFVAFPTGFFLAASYNSGLFVALMVGSVYAMRRGNWWTAGVLGALASGTRSAGFLLLLPFCYEYLRQSGRRIRMDALALGVIPLGLVGYMIFTGVTIHDPLAFSHAQSMHWGRHLDWPWIPIVDSARLVVDGRQWHQPFGDLWVHNLLELSIVLLSLAMVVLGLVGPWRVRRDQLVFPLFGLVLILFMISFPSKLTDDIPYPLVSTSRIALEVFTTFLLLGRVGRHPFVDRLLLICFLPVQGILVMRFLHSGWVA